MRLKDKLALWWDSFCALRFLIVGAYDSIFSYGVFAILYSLFGGGWGDVAVQIVTLIIGITNAYIMHRFVTYRSHGVWWKEYLRFYVVYGVQALMKMGCFFVFATWLEWNGYLVQLTLTVAFTVISFWAHKHYSFKKD